MKKSLDIKLQLNTLTDCEIPKSLLVGNLNSHLIELANTFTRGDIEVVITENNFKKFGSLVVDGLKNGGAKVKLLLIEDKDFHYAQVKSSFNGQVGAVVAVGDKNLLSAVRHYSSIHGTPCFAVATTPVIETVFEEFVYLKTEGMPAKMKAQPFNKVIIDEDIIKKASGESFSEAFILSISKLTALIDYKLNSYVSGGKVDGALFKIVKTAINVSASILSYDDYKTAIIYSQILLAIVNGKSNCLKGTGVDVVSSALSIFAPNALDHQKVFIAFEKTAKLYHLYFSNDFSSLLSLPDYLQELEDLQTATNKDRSLYYNNLKIPSEKRRELINLLIDKTKDNFKSETTLILKLLKGIKTIYQKLLNKEEKSIISYKQIKNAVTLSTYLTDKTNVLTLCRDSGVLKCAN